MFLTTRQKEVLEAQTPQGKAGMLPFKRLGVSESTVDSITTKIFQDIMEAIEVLGDPMYQDIFKIRFGKHQERLDKGIRAARKNMREATR